MVRSITKNPVFLFSLITITGTRGMHELATAKLHYWFVYPTTYLSERVFAGHLVRRESILRYPHATANALVAVAHTVVAQSYSSMHPRVRCWSNKLLDAIRKSMEAVTHFPAHLAVLLPHDLLQLQSCIINISFLAQAANTSHRPATAILAGN